MKRYSLLFAIIAVLAVGCKESNLLHPYGYDDGVAPGPVTDVRVRNHSGAATIYYTLPSDPDLSYVKATFAGLDGQEREVRASGYVDSLVVEGFGAAGDYEVQVRAYDKFENASSPLNVTVSPTTPPVQMVYESLGYKMDFGGFLVSFENTAKADIGIYILQQSKETGELEYYDVYFTEMAEGKYSVRGLPSEKNLFGLYVQDRWGNKSETTTFEGIPLPEELLDKSGFTVVNANLVPGDLQSNQYVNGTEGAPEHFFDGDMGEWNYIHTILPLDFPHRFTIDLGEVAKLSRFKTWQRPGSDVRWQHGAWKRFNVYGCTELPQNPSASDPLAGWTLLGEFESVKPSGLPLGQVSDEDIQLIEDGEEFSFEADTPRVKYLRFEVLGVHSSMKVSCMREFTLWGEAETSDEM